MAAGVISEGVLIIASVIVAGMITGIVISKVGATESYYTATADAQKEKMLSKFEIIHVNQLNDTSVHVWIKNTGLTPIQKLDLVDAYFGKVNSVNFVDYSTGTTPQWAFLESTNTHSVWSQKQTIQIALQADSPLQSGTHYQFKFTIANGVSDVFVFALQ